MYINEIDKYDCLNFTCLNSDEKVCYITLYSIYEFLKRKGNNYKIEDLYEIWYQTTTVGKITRIFIKDLGKDKIFQLGKFYNP